MKYNAIIILFFLTSCSSQIENDKNWKENKSKSEIFPLDTIEFKKPKTFSNIIGQQFVWINLALIKYPYRKNCSDKILISIDLKDSSIQRTLKEDSLSIAYYILDRFRKDGVSHFAFQEIINDELKICLYIEKNMNPIGILKTIEIPLNAEMGSEEDWKTYDYYLSNE